MCVKTAPPPLHPVKKVIPSNPSKPTLKSRSCQAPPLPPFEILVGASTPPAERKGRGVHTVFKMRQKCKIPAYSFLKDGVGYSKICFKK